MVGETEGGGEGEGADDDGGTACVSGRGWGRRRVRGPERAGVGESE